MIVAVIFPFVTALHAFCARMGYGAREGVVGASMRRMTPQQCAAYAARVWLGTVIVELVLWTLGPHGAVGH